MKNKDMCKKSKRGGNRGVDHEGKEEGRREATLSFILWETESYSDSASFGSVHISSVQSVCMCAYTVLTYRAGQYHQKNKIFIYFKL